MKVITPTWQLHTMKHKLSEIKYYSCNYNKIHHFLIILIKNLENLLTQDALQHRLLSYFFPLKC
ncbi:hypothetical protein T06_12746 [Trichinella sp. T6]|nr:hypothetical protein T06_12746 [Trichinella sp. T6]